MARLYLALFRCRESHDISCDKRTVACNSTTQKKRATEAFFGSAYIHVTDVTVLRIRNEWQQGRAPLFCLAPTQNRKKRLIFRRDNGVYTKLDEKWEEARRNGRYLNRAATPAS